MKVSMKICYHQAHNATRHTLNGLNNSQGPNNIKYNKREGDRVTEKTKTSKGRNKQLKPRLNKKSY